jgi:hypothetical protein
MKCHDFDFNSLEDVEDCLIEVDVCDDIMSCACCCYFLEKSKKESVQKVISDLKKLPNKITRLKIPIYPLPDNLPYYSFDGISTVVYNLIKTQNKKHRKIIEKHEAFIKVYYQKNSLFSIPIIIIELIFLGQLKPLSIDEFWKTLKAEVLFFTSSVGDIDVVDIEGSEHLAELLKIPLLFGYPEFKLEGVLKENKFTVQQIKEMNYLHSVFLVRLDMKNDINNNTLDLFSLQRVAMTGESLNKTDVEIFSDDDDVIRAIFNENNEIDSDDDFDRMLENLPF